MNTKSRRILFASFCLLFLIIGTAIIFYALGWRVNFENLKIQKIGAIYIKTQPKGVMIKINGQIYPDLSGIIQSGTLISDLLPKTYRVEIAKEGYSGYYKNLKVEPSRVVEILRAILIPLNIRGQTVFFNPKGTKIEDVSGDKSKFIISNSSGNHYLYDSNNASSTLNIGLALARTNYPVRIKKIMFVPFDASRFVIEDRNSLKIFDSGAKTIETIEKSITDWTMNSPSIYILKNNANGSYGVVSYNLVFKNKTILGEFDPPAENLPLISIKSANNGLVALAAGTEYYNKIYLARNNNLEKIAENAGQFSFAPDNKKIAFLNFDGSADILALEDFSSDIQKRAGESYKIPISNGGAKNFVWYKDSYHIIFQEADNLLISEIDDRPPLNESKIISEGKNYFYDESDNSIYYAQDNVIKKVNLE